MSDQKPMNCNAALTLSLGEPGKPSEHSLGNSPELYEEPILCNMAEVPIELFRDGLPSLTDSVVVASCA